MPPSFDKSHLQGATTTSASAHRLNLQMIGRRGCWCSCSTSGSHTTAPARIQQKTYDKLCILWILEAPLLLHLKIVCDAVRILA